VSSTALLWKSLPRLRDLGGKNLQATAFLCHRNLTKANRSFLYDADCIAGSPQWFEKHPQDIPFSEQAPCENESRLNGHFEQDALFTPSKHMM
jgi:hypothetical protein